jgi:hypothetical protein
MEYLEPSIEMALGLMEERRSTLERALRSRDVHPKHMNQRTKVELVRHILFTIDALDRAHVICAAHTIRARERGQ